MQTLAFNIAAARVPQNGFSLFFLGQAGFIIKGADGSLTAVDLYLSDCTTRIAGFKRLLPYLFDPTELRFDNIICTHEHPDHLDVDALPLMITNGEPKVFLNRESIAEMEKYAFKPDRFILLERGKTFHSGALKIEAVYCDHGSAAPNAVGLILTLGGKTMYIAGDTALRLNEVADIAARHIDVMAAPINGAFGNLNEDEAVTLCEYIKPELIIPYHYWNFAEHGGDPYKFMKAMNTRLPSRKYLVMRPGEGVDIV